VLRPPVQAPRPTPTPNAGWHGPATCLDWLLIVGEVTCPSRPGSTSSTTTGIVPPGAGLKSPDPSAALTFAGKLDTIGSTDATYPVASRTRTGELHERIYTPHRRTVLAAATGARNGELCGLEWSDLDLAAGTVRFR